MGLAVNRKQKKTTKEEYDGNSSDWDSENFNLLTLNNSIATVNDNHSESDTISSESESESVQSINLATRRKQQRRHLSFNALPNSQMNSNNLMCLKVSKYNTSNRTTTEQ